MVINSLVGFVVLFCFIAIMYVQQVLNNKIAEVNIRIFLRALLIHLWQIAHKRQVAHGEQDSPHAIVDQDKCYYYLFHALQIYVVSAIQFVVIFGLSCVNFEGVDHLHLATYPYF